jgi:tRNA (guanine-N7-)-methyltransferase
VSQEAILVPWRKHPFPIDWAEVFATSEPELELEIGFGDGRYTVHRAQRERDTCFVGLEISGASILRALRRVREAGLDNIRVVKTSAQFAVQHLFAPESLLGITVNFPDPWPKERHAKNRLLQRSFFELAASRLRPGGEIRLATDHEEYLASAREQGAASGLYALLEAAPPEAVFETKYALKWKAQAKPLYYQVFRRLRPPEAYFPILEREAMPHAILSGRLPEDLDFAKRVSRDAHGHVILLELCRSLSSDRLLVLAVVEEPSLQQQVLVSIRPKESGEIVVGLESFGDPLVTKAVKGAVHAVVEWLTSQAPEVKLKQASY